MPAANKITTRHEDIQQWVEKHGGKPAMIGSPDITLNALGVRVDFPKNQRGSYLSRARRSQNTSWNTFFDIFEKKNLAFIYKDKKKLSDPTLSYRFIGRDMVHRLNTV